MGKVKYKLRTKQLLICFESAVVYYLPHIAKVLGIYCAVSKFLTKTLDIFVTVICSG